MKKPITTIVTIPNMIYPEDWRHLEEKSEVRYVERKDKATEEELLEILKDSDYFMVDPDAVDGLHESFYQQIKQRNLPLKAISADITGMSWATPPAAKDNGIILMNTAGYSTVSVAEFTFALILVQLKKMDSVWHDRVNKRDEKPYKNEVLAGKTVGIVGLGNIGQKVAELLEGFDVKIIAWDRREKNLSNIKQLPLETVMEQSDILTIHLKTTDETKGMFDAKILAHAKKGQYIINEADGPLVDNEILSKAISSGQIAGYACANSAIANTSLADNEKVLTFPSQAWYTNHSLTLLRKIWVDNIVSTIDGKPKNLVD
jgi:phosphoglycerate dehydrogenase-like enzyme